MRKRILKILKQDCKVDSLTLAFVNFNDKLILTGWNWIVQIVGMKNPDESKPEFSVQKLRESHATIQELTSQIQELQEWVNCVNDSTEFQDFQSICRGTLSHVPSQPAVVPSPRSMLSRDQSMPPETWNLSGREGNVLGNPRAMFGSSQIPCQSILHASNQSATGGIPVQRSTGRPVAKGEEQTGSTLPMPIFARRPSTMNSQRRLTSKDCKNRNLILIKSQHLQRFHVGR